MLKIISITNLIDDNVLNILMTKILNISQMLLCIFFQVGDKGILRRHICIAAGNSEPDLTF
jgi:hypothetical protein